MSSASYSSPTHLRFHHTRVASLPTNGDEAWWRKITTSHHINGSTTLPTRNQQTNDGFLADVSDQGEDSSDDDDDDDDIITPISKTTIPFSRRRVQSIDVTASPISALEHSTQQRTASHTTISPPSSPPGFHRSPRPRRLSITNSGKVTGIELFPTNSGLVQSPTTVECVFGLEEKQRGRHALKKVLTQGRDELPANIASRESSLSPTDFDSQIPTPALTPSLMSSFPSDSSRMSSPVTTPESPFPPKDSLALCGSRPASVASVPIYQQSAQKSNSYSYSNSNSTLKPNQSLHPSLPSRRTTLCTAVPHPPPPSRRPVPPPKVKRGFRLFHTPTPAWQRPKLDTYTSFGDYFDVHPPVRPESPAHTPPLEA